MSSIFNVLLTITIVLAKTASSSALAAEWYHVHHGHDRHNHGNNMTASRPGNHSVSTVEPALSSDSSPPSATLEAPACFLPPTSNNQTTSFLEAASPSATTPDSLSASIDSLTAAFPSSRAAASASASAQPAFTTLTTKIRPDAPISFQTATADTESDNTTPSTQAASSTTVSTTTSTQAASNGSYWQPAAGTTWQIQLSGVVSDTTYPADVFDMDLFDNPVSTIEALHSLDKKVICYFSAGTYENWRPDEASFQSADLGDAVDGWAGEWWLNTKSASVRSIMTARIELAASNGCDGIDPDNVDGYDNPTGFNLTQADGVDYMSFLSDAAHSRGMSIGLKNAGGIVNDTLAMMEWQINEQCILYNECDLFVPFIDAGKPVFHIEYPSDAPAVSSTQQASSCDAPSGFSTLMKTLDLSAWVQTC